MNKQTNEQINAAVSLQNSILSHMGKYQQVNNTDL